MKPVHVVPLALVAAAVAAPAAGAAVWNPAVALVSGQGEGALPAVAAGPPGTAVAAWYRLRGQASSLGAAAASSGPFAAPRILGVSQTQPNPNLPPAFPAIAVGPRGEGAVAYMARIGNRLRVMVARWSPSGGFSPPASVAPGDADAVYPDVAIDAQGTALVVWTAETPRSSAVRARTVDAQGRLGPVRTVSGSLAQADSPAVAVNARGDAAVVWREDVGVNAPVMGTTAAAGGTFRAPRLVSAVSAYADQVDVAVDPAGRATAVWTQVVGGGSAQPRMAGAWTRAAGGGFGRPQVLTPATGRVAIGGGVAVDGSGNATAVWVLVPSGGSAGLSLAQAATRGPAGRFGGVRNLDRVSGATSFERPHVASNADGITAAVWERDLSSGRSQARASVRPVAGGAWSAATTISGGSDAGFPHVAVDAAGRVSAVWMRSAGQTVIGAEAATGRP